MSFPAIKILTKNQMNLNTDSVSLPLTKKNITIAVLIPGILMSTTIIILVV